MNKNEIKVVVTGDICINSLQWEENNSKDSEFSYEGYPVFHNKVYMGGALLLAKLTKLAIGNDVISPDIENIQKYIDEEAIVSVAQLDTFPIIEDSKKEVYRINKFMGYSMQKNKIRNFQIIKDNSDADIVILDDENNGFNCDEQYWPLALKSKDKSPVIIYKTNKMDFSNNLWKNIEDNHIDNTIVIINADDLRAKGVNISKGLSWEKTGLDFIWQMKNNPKLKFLANCKHLIVPLGLEGAIYFKNEKKPSSRLYFLTYEFEGGFIKEDQGKMYGLTSAFVAGLTNVIYSGMKNEELSELIEQGIREGMVVAQKYFIEGFGSEVNDTFPSAKLFIEEKNDFVLKEHIQDVEIKNNNKENCRGCWYIIKDKSSTNLAEIAYDIVKNGEKSALKYIPIAQFRNLKTVDRTEIEAYRSIKNLIAEYISTPNTVRPLSIAVFGTPGSGKSFGVTEVAASIAPKLIEKLDFNLSQFQSLDDLTAAFHKVRDVSLNGKIPLVFFDEFDSNFETKLGWLKYFLAPMQDGLFMEGSSLHPIGKAIFVFAGGTCNTYESFVGEKLEEGKEYKDFISDFQSSKGPDFISRLRGYVNILGPNQTDKKWDQLFIIRRAMLLRSLLVRKVPHLINDNGEAQVDNGVIRALLKIPKYKHESRSMEAILEMSRLSDASKWEQSHLPSKSQLKLHVDEEQFYHYMMQAEFFSEKTRIIAKAIYKQFISIYSEYNNMNIDKITSYNMLSEEEKSCIYKQVKNIPSILHKMNYEVYSVKEKPQSITIAQRELYILAEHQHKLWVIQRKQEGWKYGEIFDENKKLDPSLVSWNKLSENTKNKMIEYISLWPEILVGSSLKVEKLNYLCYCDSQRSN